MNVLLINPPQHLALASEAGPAAAAHSCAYPPLGLLYLQASVEAGGEHRVHVLDANLTEGAGRLQSGSFADLKPDVIGVTALTPNLSGVVSAITAVRTACPVAKIIVGGPHVTHFPQLTAGLPGVDFAMAGESEETFSRLVNALSSGEGDWEAIPGLYRRAATHVNSPKVMEEPIIADLDALPPPDRERIDLRAYRGLAGRDEIFTTMISSRGCPYRCRFCSTPRGATRYRSSSAVAEEANQAARLGIRHVYFTDDTFPVSGDRLFHLCEGLAKEAPSVSWSCRTAVAGIGEKPLIAMKNSGCIRIQIGVETHSDEGLRAIGKTADIGRIRDAFKATRRIGLETVAYFMLGLPSEKTPADVRKLFRFARELDPDYALFNVLTLYPGTAFYKEAARAGIVKGDPWREFAASPKISFPLPVWDEFIPREKLFRLLSEAYRSFYWRPKSLWRQAVRPGGLRGILRRLSLGFAMLKSSKSVYSRTEGAL